MLRKDRADNALIVGPRALLGMRACLTGPANILVPPEHWPEDVLARLRNGDFANAEEFCAAAEEAVNYALSE